MDFFSNEGFQLLENLSQQAQQAAVSLADVVNMDKLHEAQQQAAAAPAPPPGPGTLEPPGHTSRRPPVEEAHSGASLEPSTPALPDFAAPDVPGNSSSLPYAAAPRYVSPPPYAVTAPTAPQWASYYATPPPPPPPPPVSLPPVSTQSAESSADDAFLADLLEAGISLEEAKGIQLDARASAAAISAGGGDSGGAPPMGHVPGRVLVPPLTSQPAQPAAGMGDPGALFVGAFLAAQAVAGQVATATTSTLENVGAAILSSGGPDAGDLHPARAAAPLRGVGGPAPPQSSSLLSAAAPGAGQGSLRRTAGAPLDSSSSSSSGALSSPLASLMSYLPASMGGSGGGQEGVAMQRSGGPAVTQQRAPGSGFISVPGFESLISGTIRAPASAGQEGNPARLLAAARAAPRHAYLEAFETGCGIACEPVIGFWFAAVAITAVALRVAGVAASAALVCCGGARLNAVLRRWLSAFTDRQIATVFLAAVVLWAAWTSGFLELLWWVLLKLLRPFARMLVSEGALPTGTAAESGAATLAAAASGVKAAPLVAAGGAAGIAHAAAAAAGGAAGFPAHAAAVPLPGPAAAAAVAVAAPGPLVPGPG